MSGFGIKRLACPKVCWRRSLKENELVSFTVKFKNPTLS